MDNERVKLGILNLLSASSQTHLSIASQNNAILHHSDPNNKNKKTTSVYMQLVVFSS
jgi:hypothetical protein